MNWLPRTRSIGCWFAPAALCILLLGALPQAARGVTHESPEVQELMKKALGYLAKETHTQVGGKCLIALAFKKTDHDVSHPKIKEALEECKKTPVSAESGIDNYNLGLMIIFMCELEDESHRSLIMRMINEMIRRQKPHGGWGYPANGAGDTSQTQYAVLSLWLAVRHKYEVPLPAIENAINWLVRTQDPSGGWGYQGTDPGGNNPRVAQTPLTISLTSAALGSLYMLTDLINLPGGNLAADEKTSNLPKALQEVENQKAAANEMRRRNTSGVDGARVRKAMQDGKAWLKQHFTASPPPQEEWKHYALYAYERFESFREELERDKVSEPKWYNDIYADLRKTIQGDGHWEMVGEGGAITTSFAVLVLCRSTKKAIKRAETLGEGILLGGMGLPSDVSSLREKNGKIVESQVGGSIEDLLGILSSDDNPELLRMAESKQVITLDADMTRRASQIAQLRSRVSGGTPEGRLVAVRSLASVRDFGNVPVLLFALKDSDMRVVREADKGLRFISRKFDGVVPLEAPTREALAALQTRWREWYLSIKPDAELLD